MASIGFHLPERVSVDVGLFEVVGNLTRGQLSASGRF